MARLLPALFLAFFMHAAAIAQDWQPRDIADSVAAQIEENYFDEAKATEVAGVVRQQASGGAYDGITDPFRLASALTETIAPYDGHFRVTWSPPDEAIDGDDARGRELYSFPDMIRRNGNGFRRVSSLPANIGYIEMSNFANIDFGDPNDPVRQSADAALALVSEADAVIIDLRDNGGGAPSMVGYLTSAFTPPDADIYNVFIGRGPDQSEAPEIFYPHPRLEIPLYVLISARTGSAAEAFAYTVKNAGRATVIGEASAGAANPGGLVDAGNGFAVFVSFGAPRSPVTGTNWEGDGVAPDVQVPANEALTTAQRMALDRLARSSDAAYRQAIAWARESLDQPVPATGLAAYSGTFGPYSFEAADNVLHLSQGRRPVLTLLPLGDDTFFRSDDPLVRYHFIRSDGSIEAVESMNARGTVTRHDRSE
ncbi:S41 family peptidase [uncultured Parasphingopyxis sp.]|uniref:S41 family peptidase n=1 Tax=uncultured Parasphingopyxis sp. TaxID=1547918 RepID=UPI002609B2FD|nr:S41 family peptidase [uncultured Parasphingopyxis sp.]